MKLKTIAWASFIAMWVVLAALLVVIFATEGGVDEWVKISMILLSMSFCVVNIACIVIKAYRDTMKEVKAISHKTNKKQNMETMQAMPSTADLLTMAYMKFEKMAMDGAEPGQTADLRKEIEHYKELVVSDIINSRREVCLSFITPPQLQEEIKSNDHIEQIDNASMRMKVEARGTALHGAIKITGAKETTRILYEADKIYNWLTKDL